MPSADPPEAENWKLDRKEVVAEARGLGGGVRDPALQKIHEL